MGRIAAASLAEGRRWRRVLVTALLAVLAAATPARAQSPGPPHVATFDWLSGVNVAGAEFGPSGDRVGVDYIYPSPSSLDYYAIKGFRLVRIPFLSRRVLSMAADGTQAPTGELDTLLALVDHAARRRLMVVLDMHQYGMVRKGLIGRDPGAVEEFAESWRIIAERVGDRPNVLFGLMNEPHIQSAGEWLAGANAAIAAIRGTGSRHAVLVCGSYWCKAETWTTTPNAGVMSGVVDPIGNLAYEVHSYLDVDASGTTPTAVPTAGIARLESVTAWARANRKRLFLGEFGFAADGRSMKEGESLLRYLSANRDVWLGWAYWAGGPWWHDYMFSVEPDNAFDRPQMRVLGAFAR
jgi:endoglucanase